MTHSYSSIQVNITGDLRKRILRESMRVKSKDLYRDKDITHGRESDPHVTVKYGLHTNYATEVKPFLKQVPAIKFKLGKASLFSNPDSEYDVVKVEVIDQGGLRKLNKLLSENLDCTDTHLKYNPHVTLAYVKKGTGKQYTGELPITGRSFKADEVLFSGSEGNKVTLPLGETEEHFIGVDFDGTLAKYDGWKGWKHLGKPVPAMVNKVKEKLKQGEDVKIFTARYTGLQRDRIIPLFAEWCTQQGLPKLELTNEKTPGMHEIWDDRAVRIQRNTGRRIL